MQSAGLYEITAVDTDTLVSKFLGETPQDGAFVYTGNETSVAFMTKSGGNLPTEVRNLVGVATLTVDLILERDIEQFLTTGAYAESATKTIIGGKHGCLKKTFEITMHPKCENPADKDQDIKFLKAYVDIATELTATPEGKKIVKCVFSAMNTQVTLEAPATLTLTAGSGSANVLYWKAVATNGSGISVPGAELSSTVDDDKINFALPYGATGLTLYAGEATGPATNIKSYQVTDAEIAAGFVDAVGTLYDSVGGMTAETAVPSAATGYSYQSIVLGD